MGHAKRIKNEVLTHLVRDHLEHLTILAEDLFMLKTPHHAHA